MSAKGRTERILWSYKNNLRIVYELKLLLKELASVHAQSYNRHMTNSVTEPVLDLVHKILTLEHKIAGAEKEIQVVENVKSVLDIRELDMYQLFTILTERYISHKPVDKVIREMAIPKTTYYRRKDELVRMAEKFV